MYQKEIINTLEYKKTVVAESNPEGGISISVEDAGTSDTVYFILHTVADYENLQDLMDKAIEVSMHNRDHESIVMVGGREYRLTGYSVDMLTVIKDMEAGGGGVFGQFNYNPESAGEVFRVISNIAFDGKDELAERLDNKAVSNLDGLDVDKDRDEIESILRRVLNNMEKE